MATIYFVGTYKPIKCGIADYTAFITRECDNGKWGVLSFDLEKFGAPLVGDFTPKPDHVWYGIPKPTEISAPVIEKGLKELSADYENDILWFQHETAIWHDTDKFVTMLKHLEKPKVVTFHTLHFQSHETPSGLRKYQYELFRDLFPYVEAITVFSQGVYDAVTSAFPEHFSKVLLIKHGIHLYPEVACLSRSEAREELNDFLLYESDLDEITKNNMHKQKILVDKDAIIVGQTGFLCPFKHSESLFYVRDRLQKMLPQKRVVALRIGSPRDGAQEAYAQSLREEHGGDGSYLLETLLPANILPLAQRAFDINFYWPTECTQSGVLAHALGAGAAIAGRDMEGVGETLKEAGQLVDANLEHVITRMRDLVLNPDIADVVEESAIEYATKYSWKHQTLAHYQLAEQLTHSLSLPTARYPSDPLQTAIHLLSNNNPDQVISPNIDPDSIRKVDRAIPGKPPTIGVN
ncbi:hypothetical protein ACFLU3_00275 [Chloroflexota bacterium]